MKEGRKSRREKLFLRDLDSLSAALRIILAKFILLAFALKMLTSIATIDRCNASKRFRKIMTS